MLWCRFEKDGRASYGVVEGETVVAVEGEPWGQHRRTEQKLPLASVKLLVPVMPPTFYAIGSNYKNHVIERSKVKGFKEPKFYDRPRVGYRANSALVASGDDIVKPKDSGPRFEYEGELVAVIGKRCRNISPEEATACIFGWTIGNDVTERDWQKNDPTNLRGKNADTFKPMGPLHRDRHHAGRYDHGGAAERHAGAQVSDRQHAVQRRRRHQRYIQDQYAGAGRRGLARHR